MTNNPFKLGENQMNQENNVHLPSIVRNVIEHVSIDEIKKALFEEVKTGFEFGPTEYIPGPDTKKQSIFLKVANVMGGLDRVPKSGYNKNHDYQYVTESDVVGAVRPLMAKEKLVMMPSIRSYKQEDIPTKYSKLYMGTIEIEWILRDAESYEQVKFTMIGKGTDNLEKDIYKAISGNKKYALITLFMIDSGDDPERNDSPTDTRPNDAPSNNQNQGQNRSNNNSNGNTGNQGKNQNTGQSGANKQPDKQPEQEKVKQPTKGDLLTRWMVLDTSDKAVKDKRADFDVWYKKKQEEKWDHLAMITALTKKLQEKNQAEKDAEKKQKDNSDKQPKNDADQFQKDINNESPID